MIETVPDDSRISLRWLFFLVAWAAASFGLIRLGIRATHPLWQSVFIIASGLLFGPCAGCVLGVLFRTDRFWRTVWACFFTLVGLVVAVLYPLAVT